MSNKQTAIVRSMVQEAIIDILANDRPLKYCVISRRPYKLAKMGEVPIMLLRSIYQLA